MRPSSPPPGSSRLSRQYAAVATVFLLLVAGIVLLFGHLISRSLSRQYLEDTIVAGRDEATELARELLEEGGEGELLDVWEQRKETVVRRHAELARRHVLETITVVDADGDVVYDAVFESEEPLPEEQLDDLELEGDLGGDVITDVGSSYQIRAAVGDVGNVVYSVSKRELAERVATVRSELLRQTIAAAAVTLLTLATAFAFSWHLVQRNRRLEERHRLAEEMAALGALASNLAHEIRNPLNSINLNLEMLEEDLPGGDAGSEEALRQTRSEVGRLARLVTDFLVFARPAEPEPERMSPRRTVEEVHRFLRTEATAAGVHLRLVAPATVAQVEADPGQIRQLLINLVLNAIEAVRELGPDRRVVELALEDRDHEVVISVRDRGPGIPSDEKGRVREAFYTRRRGGTGLGLAIADRIAISHGGRLELDDVEPHGLEARLCLPAASEDGKMGALAGRRPPEHIPRDEPGGERTDGANPSGR